MRGRAGRRAPAAAQSIIAPRMRTRKAEFGVPPGTARFAPDQRPIEGRRELLARVGRDAASPAAPGEADAHPHPRPQTGRLGGRFVWGRGSKSGANSSPRGPSPAARILAYS